MWDSFIFFIKQLSNWKYPHQLLCVEREASGLEMLGKISGEQMWIVRPRSVRFD